MPNCRSAESRAVAGHRTCSMQRCDGILGTRGSGLGSTPAGLASGRVLRVRFTPARHVLACSPPAHRAA